MSELDVIVIHIRAEQAAEYERLFAEHELPRWREYKARGAFISARISRVASARATDRPREAASRAMPTPVIPPPITSTSNRSCAIRVRLAARVWAENGSTSRC